MAVKEKPVWKFKITGQQGTSTRSTVSARGKDLDSHGTRLINPIDLPFPKATLIIKAGYDGPREGALVVVEKLRHHCAVSKMLQEGGTKVVENWISNGEEIAAA